MSPSPLASGLASQIKLGPSAPKVSFAKTQQGRKTLLIKTVDAVHAGLIDEATGAKALRAAGFPDSKNPFSNRHASVGGAIHEIASPLGLSRSDVRRAGKADLSSYYQSHPGVTRIPIGDAGPPAAGVVGVGPNLGLGLIGQVVTGVGQNLVYAPGGAARLATHPGETIEKLYEHVRHPGIADAAVLGYAGAAGAATLGVRSVAAAKALRAGAGARAAVTRAADEGGSLLHTPVGKPVRIEIPGAAPSAIDPATGRIVVAEGPRGKPLVVNRPVSRNVLVRPLQRGRGKLIQRAVNKEARDPFTRTGARIAGTVSGRTTIAREIRAGRRVDLALANADAVALDKMLHGVRGLTTEEKNAITVVRIAGSDALVNPELAVQRQIDVHRHFAAIGVGGPHEADNLQRVQDLGGALKVLQNARDNPLSKDAVRFKKAAALDKAVAEQTEGRLVEAGHLDPVAAKARLDKAADIYGYPEAPPGSYFASQKPAYVAEGQKLPGFSGTPSQSRTGKPPPSMTSRVPGLGQRFTGESHARGYVAGPETTARRAILVNKALDAERHYEDLWKIGAPVKMSAYDVPFRDTQQIREEVRTFFNRLANTVHSGEDVSGVLSPGEIAKVAELLKPDPKAFGHVPVGGSQEGIRWVDRRYDVELQKAIDGNQLNEVVDAVNNFARLQQLYLRPAYILNLPGNLVMNTISEGLRVPGAGRAAVKANTLYGDDVTRWMDAGMGTSLSRSYSIGTGPMGRLTEVAAQAWNGITDMHSRRLALIAEANRQGIKTPAQMQALKAAKPGTELAEKRTLIFRTAKKNIVDYDLTPFEANVARRWIYFYPWVSRGTLWALRSLVEHPGKTFTLFELGRIGAENAHRSLGAHQPLWEERLGLVPVGGRHGDRQRALNLSSLWTYGTGMQAYDAVSDTVKALAGLPQGGGLANIATPAATLLTQGMTKNDIGGGRPTGLPGLAESLPIYGLARRGGLIGEPSATYPETGILPAVGPFLGGGPVPRAISTATTGEQAVRAAGSPRAKLWIQLDQLGEAGLASPERVEAGKAALEQATPKEIKEARRSVGQIIGVSNDIARLEGNGKISGEQATAMRAGLLTASPKQIAEARKVLKAAVEKSRR